MPSDPPVSLRRIIAALALLGLFSWTFPASPAAQPSPLICAETPCRADVPPFHRNGLPMDHPNQKLTALESGRYRRALARYPDAASCLPPAARATQDLAAFDWAAWTAKIPFEVCLNRILNALGNPERAVKWFEHFGFRAYFTTNPEGHWREGRHRLNAVWPGGTETFPAPRVLPAPVRWMHDPTFSMTIEMDPDGTVVNVGIGKAIK